MKPLTAARVRALEAVERGQVANRFTHSGNVFEVPQGVSPKLCRDLQTERLIEDVPRSDGRGHRYTQQLTKAGRDALAMAKLPKVRASLRDSEHCTYPRCKCIVSTSSTSPEPTCPKGLERHG
jgi:hypothetical protein